MAIPEFTKPYQLEDAKNIDSSGEVTVPNTFKEPTITAVDEAIVDLMAALELDWPATYAEAEPQFTALQSQVQTIMDSGIPDNTEVTYTASLDDIKEDLEIEIAADYPYTCAQCGGEGIIPTYQPDGTPTGDYMECPLCTGLGATEVQYKKDPADQNNYIPA
jgi:hypothetical protein